MRYGRLREGLHVEDQLLAAGRYRGGWSICTSTISRDGGGSAASARPLLTVSPSTPRGSDATMGGILER